MLWVSFFSQLLKDYCIKENFFPEKIGLSALWYIRKKSQNKYNIWKRNNRKCSLWDKTVSLKIHFSWNNFLIFFTKSKLARRIQENNIVKMKTEIISKYVKFVPEEWENQLSCDLKKKNWIYSIFRSTADINQNLYMILPLYSL